MKNVVKITKTQLIEMLKNWNLGAQPASIQYITEPKINKFGKQKFGSVTKLGAVNCIVNFDFAAAVNRELLREGKEANFVVQPLWKGKGKHINLCLIQHVETMANYLAYKFQRSLKSFYFDQNFNPISSAEIKQYFYDTTPQNQGVDEGREIHPRTIKIDSIKKIKFRKTTYEII